MLDYKFHHLSSRFTAGWKTEEEKREKTEGESMKTVFSPRFLVALYKTRGSVRLGNDRMA